MNKLVEYLLLLSLLLSPVYLWESGLPQVSHVIALLAILMRLVAKPRFYRDKAFVYAALFVFYSFLVDGVVYFLYRDFRTAVEPLQFAYDFLIFTLIVTLAKEKGAAFLQKVFWLHVFALLFQASLVVMGTSRVFGSSRVMGFFNDPNQMAYWALWSAVIVGGLGRALYGSWLPGHLALLLAVVIDLFAASRSAAIGLFTLVLVYSFIMARDIFRKTSFRVAISRKQLHVLFIILVVFIAGGVFLFNSGSSELFLGRADYLLERFNERQYDDTLAGRGYDRIWKFPEYLVFGAGQGAFERYFYNARFLGEIHSTWAGTLFNYGFVGFFLLVAFVSRVFFKIRYPVSLLLLSPFVYGFTTFGLRNWYFWVGLAAMYASFALVQTSSGDDDPDWRGSRKDEKLTDEYRIGR